jgi:hypothetical protein
MVGGPAKSACGGQAADEPAKKTAGKCGGGGCATNFSGAFFEDVLLFVL